MHSVASTEHSLRINTTFWLPEQDSLGNVAEDRASKAGFSLKRKEIHNTTVFSYCLKGKLQISLNPIKTGFVLPYTQVLKNLLSSCVFSVSLTTPHPPHPGYLPWILKCSSHHRAGACWLRISHSTHSNKGLEDT